MGCPASLAQHRTVRFHSRSLEQIARQLSANARHQIPRQEPHYG
jgi:hypothetical protein